MVEMMVKEIVLKCKGTKDWTGESTNQKRFTANNNNPKNCKNAYHPKLDSTSVLFI